MTKVVMLNAPKRKFSFGETCLGWYDRKAFNELYFYENFKDKVSCSEILNYTQI